MKKKDHVLLLYKRSSLRTAGKLSTKIRETRRFADNHRNHYKCLDLVQQVLAESGVLFDKKNRAEPIDHSLYSIIITVGGDGTVLQAARNATKKHIILGVNSDPEWSVGQFCNANARNFKDIFQSILSGTCKIQKIYKLFACLTNDSRHINVECLNDILICHANPAGMSRYEIQINGYCEEHRSSGVWFSSAAGSTGAIHSAGGKELPLESQDIQYRPRELYHNTQERDYQLTGGVISYPQKAIITSYMPHGRVFVDGSHVKFPFGYGNKAVIRHSSNYIQLVHHA